MGIKIEVDVEEEIFAFESLQQWINKGKGWFQGAKLRGQSSCGQDTVCVDAKGRICICGADFERAEKEAAYPIRVYTIGSCMNHRGTVAGSPDRAGED